LTAESPTNPNATITWNFGDASPIATGNTVTHIYAVAGFYTVTVTAIDQSGDTMQPANRAQVGGSVTTTLQLEVKDVLGNGTSFLNGTGQLTISSGLIRLYPSQVSLKGTMPLGANETLSGKTFTISVNNMSRSYTFDKNGNAKGYGGKISVKRSGAPAGRANFTYSIAGFLNQSLSDTVGQDTQSRPKIAVIQIQLNGNTSSYLTPLTYITPNFPGLAKFGNKNGMPN